MSEARVLRLEDLSGRVDIYEGETIEFTFDASSYYRNSFDIYSPYWAVDSKEVQLSQGPKGYYWFTHKPGDHIKLISGSEIKQRHVKSDLGVPPVLFNWTPIDSSGVATWKYTFIDDGIIEGAKIVSVESNGFYRSIASIEDEPAELIDFDLALIDSAPKTTQVIQNITNVTNNTNNITTTNISNSGSGDITVGNIGSVNNTTTIDNSFTIQTINVNLSYAITGDSKKSEKVNGTDGDDLIADGRGKDKLIGGDGADQFYFSGKEPYRKKTVDKIVDFDASEGDAIVIADEVVGELIDDDANDDIANMYVGELIDDDANDDIANMYVGELIDDPILAIADTKKDLKRLSKDGYDLLYFQPKGDLYVDGNGDSKGFGNKSEGGIIADLPNDTILTESDVLVGV